MTSLETAQRDAAQWLQAARNSFETATAAIDVGAVLDSSLTAIIEGYAARFTSDQIAQALGISVSELSVRLHQVAVRITGVQHAQPGDLIIEMDGKIGNLVVAKEFGPMSEGGPRCLGIRYPGDRYSYNLWESTDLPYPDSVKMLLVRAPARR